MSPAMSDIQKSFVSRDEVHHRQSGLAVLEQIFFTAATSAGSIQSTLLATEVANMKEAKKKHEWIHCFCMSLIY